MCSSDLDLAQSALGDLDRTGEAVSETTGALRQSGPDTARTVALGIAPDLIHQGVVDLTTHVV